MKQLIIRTTSLALLVLAGCASENSGAPSITSIVPSAPSIEPTATPSSRPAPTATPKGTTAATLRHATTIECAGQSALTFAVKTIDGSNEMVHLAVSYPGGGDKAEALASVELAVGSGDTTTFEVEYDGPTNNVRLVWSGDGDCRT